MAELSTASPYKDFEQNFKMQRDAMPVVNDQLEQVHRSLMRQSTMSHYSRRDTPDLDSFDMASSVALSALLVVLNSIREAEDIIETLLDEEEDGLDPEELSQAQGELIGAKNIYIYMIKMFGKLETSRLESAHSSMPARVFVRAIVDNMGLPNFGSYAKNFPEFMYSLSTDKHPMTTYKIKYAVPQIPF